MDLAARFFRAPDSVGFIIMDTLDIQTVTGTARVLAPEDVAVGQFVTIHRLMSQLLWIEDGNAYNAPPRLDVISCRHLPARPGVPLKVKAVCLPYVLVKHPKGKSKLIDLRRVDIALLDTAFGKAAYKALKPEKPASSSSP